jgi:hypothetical protein
MVRSALQQHEKGTGAQLNPTNSKALAIGRWRAPATVLGIELCTHTKMLGMSFGSSIETPTKVGWAPLIRAVRIQAGKYYVEKRCLDQRVQYVQQCLVAKLWYVSQFQPPFPNYTQQITSVCTWFIRKGTIFRVPATTLQRPKSQGG